MSRNGIGIMYYYSSIWNSGSYIIQLNKKIGFFVKMFVCSELHKNINNLKPEEKQKLKEYMIQTKELKSNLNPKDIEQPSLEEYRSYLNSIYTTFEKEEKNGIINLSTPNKFRLLADLCEPLSKFNALDGPFLKFQQYERYKAKKIEEDLKYNKIPSYMPMSKFAFQPVDDIKYFSAFKLELMEINSNKINVKEKDNMFNQMMNFNMNNNPYNQNDNMNNPYNPNNNMNNNPYNQNDNMNNPYNPNNNMNNNPYNQNDNMNNLYNPNNNMNNNPYNQNDNMNNLYNPNNNMNNNPNLQQQNIGNEFITQNQLNQNQKDNIDLESLSNFPDLSSTYLNSQTLNSNNDTLNEGFANKNYINHYDVIEEPEEIFYINDTIISEKKINVSNKIKTSIDEIKKNNIPLAMQNIANCIGILKNFPKDANSNFK